ncbi:MAG TPA: hypothetical protein VGM21_08705 [Actinomycetota bacterium]|jgi:hypothetical protein
MALTVPLLALCLASPPGTHVVGAAAPPRAALLGLPGTQQGVLSDRPPLNLLLSARRDDRGRTPAALGQLGAAAGVAALAALAALAFGAASARSGRALVAAPRAPPAR